MFVIWGKKGYLRGKGKNVFMNLHGRHISLWIMWMNENKKSNECKYIMWAELHLISSRFSLSLTLIQTEHKQWINNDNKNCFYTHTHIWLAEYNWFIEREMVKNDLPLPFVASGLSNGFVRNILQLLKDARTRWEAWLQWLLRIIIRRIARRTQ